MDRRSSFAGNLISRLGLVLFKVTIPLILMPYIYRQVSPSEIGSIYYILAIMMYFYILGDLGSTAYMFRETVLLRGKERELKSRFTEIFLIRFAFNSLALLAYLVYVSSIGGEGIDRYLYYAAGIQIVATFFNVDGFLEGIEKFHFVTIKTMLIRIVTLVLIFLYVREDNPQAGFNYLMLLSLFVLLNNLTSFVFLMLKINPFGSIRKIREWVGSHLKSTVYIFITTNVSVFFLQLDKIIIGTPERLIEVGYYSLAERVILVAGSFILAALTVMAPRLGALIDNQDSVPSSDYEKRLHLLISIVLYILFPISCFMYGASNEILLILGGKEYLGAEYIFKLFTLYLIVYIALDLLKTNVFMLFRKEKVYFLGILPVALLGGVIKVLFREELSSMEILGLTVISSLAITFGLAVYAYRSIKLKLFNRNHLLMLLLSLPIMLTDLISWDEVFESLAVKIAVTIVYYGIVSIIFRVYLPIVRMKNMALNILKR